MLLVFIPWGFPTKHCKVGLIHRNLLSLCSVDRPNIEMLAGLISIDSPEENLSSASLLISGSFLATFGIHPVFIEEQHSPWVYVYLYGMTFILYMTAVGMDWASTVHQQWPSCQYGSIMVNQNSKLQQRN